MKKFFIKIFIMFILLTLGIVIIILIPLPRNSYELAVIDKNLRLVGTKSPKIVLAGGSNCAFGIDSAKIQNNLHIPVVNMGVNGCFGLGRILDDISPFLNKGDILLIIPEYENFNDFWNGKEAAYELIFDVRQTHLSRPHYYGLPNDFSNYLSMKISMFFKNIINKTSDSDYTRDGFNEYGDYIKHLGMENIPFQVHYNSITDNSITFNQTYLNRFFRFIDDFSMRGIKVVLSYPSYQEQSFRYISEMIKKLDAECRAKENLLVISNPESYCFPANYFFDTVYHLNREGRVVRTGQLIQDLQASGLFNIPIL